MCNFTFDATRLQDHRITKVSNVSGMITFVLMIPLITSDWIFKTVNTKYAVFHQILALKPLKTWKTQKVIDNLKIISDIM